MWKHRSLALILALLTSASVAECQNAQPGEAESVVVQMPEARAVHKDGTITVVNLADIRAPNTGDGKVFVLVFSANFEPDNRFRNDVAEWAPRLTFVVDGGTFKSTGNNTFADQGLQSNGTWVYAYAKDLTIATKQDHLTVAVRAHASVHGDGGNGTGVKVSNMSISLRPVEQTWAEVTNARPIPTAERAVAANPPHAGTVTVNTSAIGWEVNLTNEQWQQLRNGGVAASALVPDPHVAAALALAVAVGDIANTVGGNNGVTIKGCWAMPTLTAVLPR